ncbi:MAG TPA: DUF1572 family protein [Gemmatimonadaceae bacterium]|nr:DUF1572 family protein [Gemmatimonadaceae bacterium]
MTEATSSDLDALGSAFLTDVRKRFESMKTAVERAAAQVSDEQFFQPLEEDGNSIALLMKHMSGNLESRFTDFLASDGEKSTRDRDGEFVREAGDTRETIAAKWERGWSALWGALDSLSVRDLLKTVRIRGEPHTVVQALLRQVAHQSQHAGQVVILARHWAGEGWETLSIPRGKSKEFGARMRERAAGPEAAT